MNKFNTQMKYKRCVLFLFVLGFLNTSVPAQTGNSEIFIFSVSKSGNRVALELVGNISNSPGYDNQPSFGPEGKSVLFTSIRNGNSPDIYEYFFESKQSKQITNAADGEYTPRAKDRDTITFVREGNGQAMSVWSYDRRTKAESPALVNKEPVAYYDWNSDGGALVWIRYASMAHFVNPLKKVNAFVTDRVLPSSPQNIPGTLKFSFVHRQGNDEVWIKEFDPETRAVRPIVQTKDGKIDYCWLTDAAILTGTGFNLYRFDEKTDKEWVLFGDLSRFGLKDITRLAASKDGKMIAVVSNQ